MNNTVRMGCLVVLGIIAFMVVAPMFNGGDQTEQPGVVEPVEQQEVAEEGGEVDAQDAEAEAAAEADGEAEAASDGDAAELGIETTVNDVRWTIIEAADVTADLGDDLSPEGKLIGVRFTVENLTGEPLTMLGLELTDDAGNSYSYLSDGLQFIEEAEACETETIEPESSVTCTAIYDVAADADELRAVVTDLNMLGGEREEIPLPIN